MGGRWVLATLAVVFGMGAAFLAWMEWDRRAAPPIVIEDPRPDAAIVVAVEGGVATPGVYEVPANARVYEVLARAGGTVPGADLAAVNPAARVQDGERLIVPLLPAAGAPVSLSATAEPGRAVSTEQETSEEAGPTPSVGPEAAGSVGTLPPVDINTATVSELDDLPGIGPALAQRIVDYRSENGPFRTVADLASVQGISERMVEEMGSRITVSP